MTGHTARSARSAAPGVPLWQALDLRLFAWVGSGWIGGLLAAAWTG